MKSEHDLFCEGLDITFNINKIQKYLEKKIMWPDIPQL